MATCIYCGKITAKTSYTYCSNQCQQDLKYQQYIEMWKRGEVNGSRGIRAKNISSHLRRYLKDKYGNSCSLCGWDKVNSTTGIVPLEIDHIDGNADNNVEENLRMICPNCHSLTATYRNLNIGKGREWRKLKYLKAN